MKNTTQKPSMQLGKRTIGLGHRTYIIAELSCNHGQHFERALSMVQAAKDAGADAVKLQTYVPETMTLESSSAPFQIQGGTPWDGKNLFNLYKEAYTPWEWHPKLQEAAVKAGLDFFSTAYDASAIEFLERLGVPAHKIASFEIVDLSLIKKMAATGKPLFISTGMATLAEVAEAVQTARDAGARELALFKCTSSYPAPPEEMNLQTIAHLSEAFQAPVGLSDHTLGIAVPVAAVALGACVIEKHFTLSRGDGGPDAGFSLEPAEFKAMVEAVRTAEAARGSVHYGLTKNQEKSLAFRRSLFVVEDLKAGEIFTEKNVKAIRPSHGLAPKCFPLILGRTATTDLPAGTPLSWGHVGGSSTKP